LRFGTQMIRFRSPPLNLGTGHFHYNRTAFWFKNEKADIFTGISRFINQIRGLRKWGIEVINRKSPPFWQTIVARSRTLAVKTDKVGVPKRSDEVKKRKNVFRK